MKNPLKIVFFASLLPLFTACSDNSFNEIDGALLKNDTTPDGYKVNEEGIWKTADAIDNREVDKQEQNQEANSNLVEREKQDSNPEANASDKKE